MDLQSNYHIEFFLWIIGDNPSTGGGWLFVGWLSILWCGLIRWKYTGLYCVGGFMNILTSLSKSWNNKILKCYWVFDSWRAWWIENLHWSKIWKIPSFYLDFELLWLQILTKNYMWKFLISCFKTLNKELINSFIKFWLFLESLLQIHHPRHG